MGQSSSSKKMKGHASDVIQSDFGRDGFAPGKGFPKGLNHGVIGVICYKLRVYQHDL